MHLVLPCLEQRHDTNMDTNNVLARFLGSTGRAIAAHVLVACGFSVMGGTAETASFAVFGLASESSFETCPFFCATHEPNDLSPKIVSALLLETDINLTIINLFRLALIRDLVAKLARTDQALRRRQHPFNAPTVLRQQQVIDRN